MKSVVVSAHNPMTGGRHLGHYVSTMIDWLSIEKDHELFIIIDDLIATILYPRSRKEIERRTFQVAKEFIATGVNFDENHLVLTSMIPEMCELSLFASIGIDHEWCRRLYTESFAGLLDSYQRKELNLPRYPSLAEVSYPQICLAALTIGLRTDFFQGGEEMRGYLQIMEAMVEGFQGITLRVPALLTTKCTFLPGTDGNHMWGENAVYLSDSEEAIYQSISKTKSLNVFKRWCMACNQQELVQTFGMESDNVSKDSCQLMADYLVREFSKFRDFRISNQEIIDIFKNSSIVARERLKELLIEAKTLLGVTGFSR